jgi:guanine deaminase
VPGAALPTFVRVLIEGTLMLIRGPILNPLGPEAGEAAGSQRPRVAWWPDGVLVSDARGLLVAAGPWAEVAPRLGLEPSAAETSRGILVPPLLDAHIHVPQHPIRGRFAEGIGPDPPGGRLLASLERNVFPAEGRCESAAHARDVVAAFHADTLAQGVVGGAAYMTVHAAATRVALEMLPDTWSVGLVLMERHCPAALRTDEAALDADVAALAADFGRRLIVTDRFAVSVDTPLRRRGVALARRHGLRMQTHLDEQFAEKRLVEEVLYPDAASYADVYRRDGLLDCEPILAHCVRSRPEEFALLAATRSTIAHCPVSNMLLGSGVMPLDEVRAAGIPWCLCTDVGASPTTSLFCEMAEFLKVHAATSRAATPEEALWRATFAPAVALGLADRLGSFTPGRECSFIEILPAAAEPAAGGTAAVAGGVAAGWPTAAAAILHGLLGLSPGNLAAWRDEADPRCRAIAQLRATGLEAGPELAILESDVRETARRCEGRVVRTILRGVSPRAG